MSVRYRPKAVADLGEIAAYAREHWGEERARAYIRRIRVACEALDRFPELGILSQVPGYRRLSVESHAIYYRVMKSDVVITRVLHERQLPSRHL